MPIPALWRDESSICTHIIAKNPKAATIMLKPTNHQSDKHTGEYIVIAKQSTPNVITYVFNCILKVGNKLVNKQKIYLTLKLLFHICIYSTEISWIFEDKRRTYLAIIVISIIKYS